MNKRLLAVVALTASFAITCGVVKNYDAREALAQAQANDARRAQLQRSLREWNRQLEIAGSTPRFSLPPVVDSLSRVASDIAQQEADPCTAPSRGALNAALKRTVDGYLLFVGDPHYSRVARDIINDGAQALREYETQVAPCNPAG